MSPLQTRSFGPWAKGTIDSVNPLLDTAGALRVAKNLIVVGLAQVRVRGGTTAAMTFQDDQATPAAVTSIRAIAPFKDRALVVAHSTTTDKTYVYVVKADFTGWYDATDTLTATTTAEPTGVLWTTQTTAPDVTVAEGLGTAYIAHADAADSTALNWPTKMLAFSSGAWTVSSLASDLDDDSSAETLYFSGVVAFQQHLWGWGFNSGTTAADAYDPSMARFSGAIFADNGTATDLFAPTDSITLGDRVKSEREKIIGGAVAGNALLLFGREVVSRVTGYGRDTWQKTTLERSYGLVGPKAYVVAGDTCYYWSSRGPMRVTDRTAPEPLWDAVIEAAAAAALGGDPASIVAGFAKDLDQVQFFYQADETEGQKRFAAFDVRRNQWTATESAVGVVVGCAGAVDPVVTTASPPAPPSAAPTIAAATSIGTTYATVNWTNGDATAQTEVWYQLHTGGTWTKAQTVAPGVTAYQLTGLLANTGYDARVRHVKNGQFSTYSTNTTPYFTTDPAATAPEAPTNFTATSFGEPHHADDPTGRLDWTNPDPTATTQIWRQGPSESAFTLFAFGTPGQTSYTIGPVPEAGMYQFKLRAARNGLVSSFTTVQTVKLNTPGPDT